jgi:hypothetical protein
MLRDGVLSLYPTTGSAFPMDMVQRSRSCGSVHPPIPGGYDARQGDVLRKHSSLRVVIQYEGCLQSTFSADHGESEPCRVCLRDGTSSRFASANTSTLA